MPLLPPVYYANFVYGRENFTAISYNASTGAWTVTPNGSTRVQVITSDPDQTAIVINGRYSMFVFNDGTVHVGDLTKHAISDSTVPRLDFMRQAGPVPRKFASLNQDGLFWVYDIDEKTPPTGVDRMYLMGNQNSSVGLDGLLAPSVAEISLIIPTTGMTPPGPMFQDEAGRQIVVSHGGNMVPMVVGPSGFVTPSNKTVGPLTYQSDQYANLLARIPT